MKKLIILLSMIVIILTACQGMTSEQSSGMEDTDTESKMPFKHFVKSDVQEVNVFAEPLEVEVPLSKDQIIQLVDILKEVVIYEQVSSETLTGQMIHYQIVKSDGSILTIKDINPYLIIDDVWYKAKDEPCEDLIQLANEVINEK